jgi:hypothetical protein
MRRREVEGLSYAQLARETGIPVGTLASWARRLRSEQADRPREGVGDFVEVIPAGRASEEIEITLPSGVQVRAPAAADRTELVRLVAAILSC